MSTKAKGRGQVINVTATGNITVNAVRAIGTLAGVALISGTTGDVVPHAVEEVWNLPKDTSAIGQGALVYVTSTGDITTTATGNTLAGKAFAAAATGASTVDVKLNA